MTIKSSNSRVRARPPQAYTDLYDEQRRAFLVQYPIPLVVALGLSGVVAFMVTGFLGYRDSLENPVVQSLFGKPWLLYLWFCALVLTLQISILRHRSLRSQLTRTLVVTIVAIIFVGVFDIYNQEILTALQNLLSTLLNTQVLLQNFGKSPWTYSVINFGILAVYWLDTIRRWVRSARGKSPFKPAEIGLDSVDGSTSLPATKQTGESAPPTISELVSGDLIAGAFLTLLLSLFLQPGVINFIGQSLQPGSSASALSVNNCTLALPLSCLAPGGGVANPPTLAFIDLVQTLIYLPLGLIVLALSATIAGLSVPGGVTGVQQRNVPANQEQGDRGAQGVAGEVGMTIFKALQAALTRRVRIAMDNFAVSLRSVIWPALILIGMFAIAGASRSIEQYLHLLSDQHTTDLLSKADLAGMNSSPRPASQLSRPAAGPARRRYRHHRHRAVGLAAALPGARRGEHTAVYGPDRLHRPADLLDLLVGALRLQRPLLADPPLESGAVPPAGRNHHHLVRRVDHRRARAADTPWPWLAQTCQDADPRSRNNLQRRLSCSPQQTHRQAR